MIDAGSGPAAPLVTADADTSSVGSAFVQLTGRDVAGHTTTVDCGYRVEYGFSGFEAPVDAYAINVAKAGSAIPLKWRLTDHAGNPVSDLASVGVASARHSCDSGAPEDTIEEVSSGGSVCNISATAITSSIGSHSKRTPEHAGRWSSTSAKAARAPRSFGSSHDERL